jgi:hypothetical protein
LVAFAVAVEEGVTVVDVSFVAITCNINKQDDTHFLHLRVRVLFCRRPTVVFNRRAKL